MNDIPRVRVTGPSRRRASPHRSGRREIDAGTELGRVFMGALLAEQLRLALGILLVLVVTVGSLPLAFYLAPSLTQVTIGAMPLPWLLLGGLVYPWLFLLGWLYVRRSEANERDFIALVEEVDR